MNHENEKKYFETNRELWNNKTPHHAVSAFYDLEGFKSGKSSLNATELEALGDVKGKSLLHLQCHFGMDTLSWSRMGAEVTGIDFSEEAIKLAKSLSTELGLPGRFIQSNVYHLSEQLEEEFDIVFTSYGTITWLPDLDRWAAVVNRHLKAGGTFCIADFHPAYMMFEFPELTLDFHYFNQDDPYMEETAGTYADTEAPLKGKEYFWNHSLAETCTALLKQGLVLKDFQEYPYAHYNAFPGMIEDGKGNFVIKGKEGMIPLMYRYVFEKPAAL